MHDAHGRHPSRLENGPIRGPIGDLETTAFGFADAVERPMSIMATGDADKSFRLRCYNEWCSAPEWQGTVEAVDPNRKCRVCNSPLDHVEVEWLDEGVTYAYLG